MIEQLPTGVFADAQKLWLLLSFQQRESAPSQEAVEDALAVLSSRLVGVLKAVNGGNEYALTMSPAMALARVRALADAVAPAPAVTLQAPLNIAVPPTPPMLASTERDAPVADSPTSPDFASLQSDVIHRLQVAGLSDPRVVSKRHVVMRRGRHTIGLAFRT